MPVKFQLISDLHLDFHKDHGVSFVSRFPVLSDLLVIAGDIGHYSFLEDALSRFCDKFDHVIFVAGNHEYYGSDFQTVENTLRRIQSILPNFYWLENDHIMVDGQSFVGATLWYEENPQSKDPINKMRLNDFNLILDCDPIAFNRNRDTRNFLTNQVKKGDVVITHHMPSWACVLPKFQGSPLNVYFATNMDSVIHNNEPTVWCFAHTHQAQDFMLHNTRLVCNPLAYPSESNSGFNDNLVIKV